MDTLILYLAVSTLVLFVVFGIELMVGNRSIRFLRDQRSSLVSPAPKVSIIIPARNEERHIEEALRSVLSQDYEDLEIIVIDDRSTDRTGAILDRIAQADARVCINHITELPRGWLGKNHALYTGGLQATGELLLFTDADVVMQPSAVRRAVSYMLSHHLDHLTVAPEGRMPGVLVEVCVGVFGIISSLYVKPWRAKDPKSRNYIGIGPFNLVRAPVYWAVGAHRAIALRPDDDMVLGKRIKRGGYRQDFLFGRGMLLWEWYASVREMGEGLMKNAFVAFEYRIRAVVIGSIGQFLLHVWPFLGLVLTQGVTRLLNAVIVLLIVCIFWDAERLQSGRRWLGLASPIAMLFFIYIQWRAMLTTLLHDGIEWRGTHYSLAELRENRL